MASTFCDRAFRTLPLLVMAAAAAGAMIWGEGWTKSVAAVPWLVSLAVVGLPHGAVDGVVSWRTWGGRTTVRLAVAYVACIAIVLALFVAFPVAVIVVFAAVSIWHFGMAHADGQDPPHASGMVEQFVAALGRGGLVLGLPLACHPEATAGVIDGVVGLVTGRAAGVDGSAVRMVGVAVSAAALAAFAIEARRTWRRPGGQNAVRRTAAELVVIGTLGAATDPLFAVGLYFLCWHAWRQMLLLAPLVVGGVPSDAVALGRAVAAIHRAALPLLIPTWIALGAAWWLLSPEHSPRDVALLSLVAYLIVTPSHDLLVDSVRRLETASGTRVTPAGGRCNRAPAT